MSIRGIVTIAVIFFAYMIMIIDAAYYTHPILGYFIFGPTDFKNWGSSKICNDDYKFQRKDICNWIKPGSEPSCPNSMRISSYEDVNKPTSWDDKILTCYIGQKLVGCACVGENENDVIKFEPSDYLTSGGSWGDRCIRPEMPVNFEKILAEKKKAENPDMIGDADSDSSEGFKFYRKEFHEWRSARLCYRNYEKFNKEDICDWISPGSYASCPKEITRIIFLRVDGTQGTWDADGKILTCHKRGGKIVGCASGGKNENDIIKFKAKEEYIFFGGWMEYCFEPQQPVDFQKILDKKIKPIEKNESKTA